MSYFDEILIDTLQKKGIGFLKLSKTEEAKLTDEIQKKFTFVGNKIDWNTIKKPIDLNNLDRFEALAKISEGLSRLRVKNICFLGDSAIDHAYIVQISDIRETIDVLSEIPQHTYIFPESLCWIACITFEGDINYADLRPTDCSPPPHNSSNTNKFE
ncbi:hypothetical protein HBO04_18805 [Pseudomonas proteolytica]|uniref:hypothetical protein n=1 Tax=Pseudomonas proteolytica TaxID=219574 RepID=UPI001474546F|nr:hypothetical protein [Pseudomonas proteolytica]NMZ02174.1 hypothetical protein [Pseudomonas proteolytica]